MYRNIVISGASSGLGEALAKCFSVPGTRLGLLGRNQDRLVNVSDSCKKKGAETVISLIDVRNREELRSWLTEFDDRYPVDLVIANAGIMSTASGINPVESIDAIADIFDTNFAGVLSTIHPVLERMWSRKNGSIAIISSLCAYRGIPLFPAYSASKAALKSYFEAIRPACASANVFVSIICPGFINTPMNDPDSSKSFLQMDVSEAARIIRQGIEKKSPLIVFPYSHILGLRLLKLLPERIVDRILYKIFLDRQRNL